MSTSASTSCRNRRSTAASIAPRSATAMLAILTWKPACRAASLNASMMLDGPYSALPVLIRPIVPVLRVASARAAALGR